METQTTRHPAIADRRPRNAATCPLWRQAEQEPYLDDATAGYCGDVEHAHTCVNPTDYETCPFYGSAWRER